MAKKAYIGVNDTAHKIKKGYIGVDGIARRIKKAYIGIGGVARPCWGGDEKLSYYGRAASLRQGKDEYAAAHVGNCALFGGGWQTDSWTLQECVSEVESVNTSFTSSYQSYGLSKSRRNLSATSTGDYALFGGGNTSSDMSSNSSMSNVVDALNASLVRYTPSSPLSYAREDISATHVGNYALFGGGYNYSSYINTIDVYSNSLTKQGNKTLSRGKRYLASTHVGQYAIFAGGKYGSDQSNNCNIVDAYDTSLTYKSAPNLSSARHSLSAAYVGNYAIFGGGYSVETGFAGSNSSPRNYVDVYDVNLTKINTAENLTYAVATTKLPAASVGDRFALFYMGNQYDSNTNSSRYMIDVYDSSLTKTMFFDAPLYYANTHVGNYTFSGDRSSINAFTIMET